MDFAITSPSAPAIFSCIYQDVSGQNGGDRSPKEKSH